MDKERELDQEETQERQMAMLGSVAILDAAGLLQRLEKEGIPFTYFQDEDCSCRGVAAVVHVYVWEEDLSRAEPVFYEVLGLAV